MLIRVENPADAIAIDNLLKQVFPSETEAELVRTLREDGLLTLGMVAADEQGKIIGHIAFSPVFLNDEDCLWVGLAPLAVAPQWQGKGIGRALVSEAIDTLSDFNYAAIVVLGDPAYYQHFGFKSATAYHLECEWPDMEHGLQVYPLNTDTLEGARGMIHYSEPFSRLFKSNQ